MGVTIQSNSKSLHMGYGGFARLRIRIAEAIDKEELLPLYRRTFDHVFIEETQKWYDYYNKKIDDIIQRKNLDIDVIDFLHMSDCDGKIDSLTAGKILTYLNSITEEDSSNYGYALHPVSLNDFKNLLQDCVDNNCNMEWY